MKENVLYNNEIFKKLIVKHSKQLIDLMEKDDYVNGSKVLTVMEKSKRWVDTLVGVAYIEYLKIRNERV